MEELVKPTEYTPEILSYIDILKYRMESTLIKYTLKDIRVFRYNDRTFILANPILGEEPSFDDNGHFEKMVPLRNITIISKPSEWKMVPRDDSFFLSVKPGIRLRILRRDLCIRI